MKRYDKGPGEKLGRSNFNHGFCMWVEGQDEAVKDVDGDIGTHG